MIETSKIRMDGGTQSRAQINDQTVAEYAEAMQDESPVFPPIVVYYDGSDYWLADGFHRVYAWLRNGRREVPAEIRQGDRRAAVLHSCAANAIHGLRRTNDDKRRAVMTLLEDAEWGAWSNREIARRCGVSDVFVGKLRDDASANGLQIAPERKVERGGTTYTVDTSNIGKSVREHEDAVAPVAAPVEPEPVAFVAEAIPEPEPIPDPYGYAKLTEAALLDLADGLRAELEEAKARIRKQTHEIADLKAQIKNHTDDKDEVIRRLSKEAKDAKAAKFRAEEDLTAWKRQVHGLKKEIAALKKSLAAQVVEL